MFRYVKVVGSVTLALAFVAGIFGLSSTSVALAAGLSSRPSLQAPQLSDRVPGWCNWDNDYDKDDWCWSVPASGSSAPGAYAAPSGNGYAAPSSNGYSAPSGNSYSAPSSNGYTMPNASGTVTGTAQIVPYGAIIGQTDPQADSYGSSYNSGYSNGYGMNGYGGRSYGMNGYGRRFYLFRPFRFFRFEERREIVQEPTEVFPRNFRLFRRSGVFFNLPPWWMMRMR